MKSCHLRENRDCYHVKYADLNRKASHYLSCGNCFYKTDIKAEERL